MSNKELYQDEATGLWLEREVQFQKRDKMTRREWAVYFDQEEIDEETYIKECQTNQWLLNRNLS